MSILVAVKCLVYNHEPYIRECLDGFVMQKTNFKFVAIVHDDASTDRSAEIIKEYAEKYPDIIKPILETENQYSKNDGSLRRIMDAAVDETGAKYVAMCEGDDYWIDPYKLQKQVDILENDNAYTMCFSDYKNVDKDNKEIFWPNRDNNIKRSYSGDIFAELIRNNYVQTCTMLYRKAAVIDLSNINTIDYEYALLCALKGNCSFLQEQTACYRIHSTSIIHTQYQKIYQIYQKVWIKYVVIYNSEKTIQRTGFNHLVIMSTICSVLINKLNNSRKISSEDYKMLFSLLTRFPKLFLYIPIGIILRIFNRIKKRINNLH